MNSIDERIVEMQFDNKQFENGIQQSMDSLETFKKQLRFNKADDGLNRIGDSVDRIASNFTLWGRIGLNVMDRVASRAVNTGERLIKSLSVDQIASGWRKYEQKTSSVQTLVNSTGKTLDEINGYLDKLMWFSDETSYNFSEMTSSLATMTSSGGDIEKLIPMIEGIATATAFAGKGASEFSRVIYNLNQSYGQGYLSFMDWKSVEQANVGSEQLKQTIIDTGIALGTLKTDSSGVVKTLKGTVVTAANMGTTLNEKWATSEVMEQAFGKFGSVIEEAYQLVQNGEFETAADAIASLSGKFEDTYYNAAKAAQEAKTFTEAIDATKDAVSSGWMKSFEIIFGNYEEAKILWTDVANILWDAFASGSEARNELLQAWKDEGGRDDLVSGFVTSLEALLNICRELKGAIQEIFPTPSVETLTALTKGVKDFSNALLKFSGEEDIEVEVEATVSTNVDPEELERTIKQGMSGEDVKKLQSRLSELGLDVGPEGIDGIFGPRTLAALKAFQKESELTVDGIYDSATHAALWEKVFPPGTETTIEKSTERVSRFSKTLDKIKRIVKGAAAIFGLLWNKIKFGYNVVVLLLDILSPIGDAILTIGALFGDFFVALYEGSDKSGKVTNWLEKISKWLEPISTFVDKASTKFLKFFGIFKTSDGSFQSIAKDFKGLWAVVKENSKKKLNEWGVWDSLVSIWDKVTASADKVKASFETLWNTIKEYWDKIKSYLGEKYTSLFGGNENDDGDSKNFASTIIERIGNGVVVALDWLSETAARIPEKIEKIKTTVSDLWAKIKGSEKASAIVEKVTGFFTGLWESITSFISGISENGLWTTVSNFITNFTSKDGLLSKGFDFIKGILEDINEFFGGTWGTAIGITIAVVVLKTIISAITDTVIVLKGVFSLLTSLGKGYLAQKRAEAKVAKFEAMANLLTRLALCIGVMVAAVYILGTMKTDALIRGSIALGAIVVVLTGLVVGLYFLDKALSKNKIGKDKTLADNMEGLGRSILAVSGAILIIAFAIRLLGGMSTPSLIQGVLSILAILVVLGFSMKLMTKASKRSTIELKGFLAFALSLLVIVGVIKRLAKMPFDTYAEGLLKLAGVFLVLRIFMGGFKKNSSGTMAIKGMLSFSLALLVIIGVIKKIAKMDLKTYGHGLLGLIGIMIVLRLFIGSMQKLNSGNGLVKMSGLIAVAIAIGLLTGVLFILSRFKMESLAKGLFGLIGVCFALRLLLKYVGSISIKGSIGFVLSMVGLIAVMLVFCNSLKKIAKMDLKTYGHGLLGLIGVCFALRLLLKYVGSVSVKGGIGFVLSMVGLIAVMLVFCNSLKKIEKINTSKMLAFSASLGIIFLSLGAFTFLVGKVGIKGILYAGLALIAIVAIIAGVIAAFAGLRKVDGFQEFMNSGAESIGEIFGNFSGSLKAAELKTFSKLASSFTEESVNSAIGCAQLLVDFEEGLPGYPDFVKLVPWAKSNLSIFSQGMSDFGVGFTNFATAISGVTFEGEDGSALSEKATKALEIAKSISTFASNDLPDYPEGAARMMLWFKSDLELFSEDMDEFGTGFSNFATAISGVTFEGEDGSTLSEKATKALEIAKALSTFASNDLPDYPENENVRSWFTTYKSDMAIFSGDISSFGTGFSNFANAISGIVFEGEDGSGLEDKALKALDIAKAISLFASNDLPEYPDNANVQSWFTTFTSNMGLFSEDMASFGEGFNTFATEMGKIKAEVTPEQVETAVACAEVVATFLSGLGDLDIEADKSWISEFFTGDTTIDTVLNKIPEFGESLRKAGDSLSGLSDKTLESDVSVALKICGGIVSAFTRIAKVKSPISFDSFTYSFDLAIESLGRIGVKVKQIATDTEGVDINSIANLITSISTLFSSTPTVDSENPFGAELGGLSTTIDEIVRVCGSRTSEFSDIGSDYMVGLGMGISKSGIFAILAAEFVTKKMVEKVKEILDMNSPSKVGAEIGMNWDAGLANGVTKYGKVVTDSAKGVAESIISTTKGSLTTLSSLIEDGIDADPVVRPVVDLSNVSEGARAIGSMIGGSRQFALDSTMSNASSAARSMSKARAASQNGGTNSSVDNSVSTNHAVNLTGNNFYIRNEQDIRSLASEIAALTWQQQLSLGAI